MKGSFILRSSELDKLASLDDDPRVCDIVQSEVRLKHLTRAQREITKPYKIGKFDV